MNTNDLNVSGATKLNHAITCFSSLNVSGITALNNKTLINGFTPLELKILLSGQDCLIPFQTSTDALEETIGFLRASRGRDGRVAQSQTSDPECMCLASLTIINLL